jgi:CheY-like chemotaxis protein
MIEAPSTILIVDDYSDNRRLLSTWLRAQGYRVIEAENGNEALLQANRTSPDLILMDLTMPGLDGIEATRQIRQRRTFAHTPIFAISAYATREVREDALAAGCNDVFAKPVDFAALLNRIRGALATRSFDRIKARAAGVK